MSQSYSKGTLKEMGKKAAQKYVSGGTPMNDTIEKIAKERGLNDHQVKRVCEFANHKVNAKIAEDSAYTTFDLADPDRVLESKEASFAGAYLGGLEDEPAGNEKTASTEEGLPKQADLLEDVADYYGVGLNLRKVAGSDSPVYRFMKMASEVLYQIEDQVREAKHAAMGAEEKIFEEVKQALLDGIPLEKIQKDLKSKDKAYLLEKIWPRLEAEGLVKPSHYEEGGPYSEHRRLKKAEKIESEAEMTQKMFDYELPEDSPLLKSANSFEESVHELETGLRSFQLICSSAEKVASMDTSLSERKKSARLGEQIEKQADKTAGAIWEGMKAVGKGLGKGAWEGGKKTLKGAHKASKSVGRKILGGPEKSFTDKANRVAVAGAGTGFAMSGAEGLRDSLKKKDITPGV